jgi:hypothetical protein
MKRTVLVVALVTVAAACSSIPGPWRKAPAAEPSEIAEPSDEGSAAEAPPAEAKGEKEPQTTLEERLRDLARIEPREGEDAPTQNFDESKRNEALAKRFPGADTIDLVRVLQWTNERSGACWTDSAAASEVRLDARYRIAGGKELTAGTVKELKDQGWLVIYRAPNGTGFERRAAFDSIALELTTEYGCSCRTGSGVKPERETTRLRVRFHWQKGKMPEASGAILKSDGTKQGLKIGFAPGNLLTYEVPFGSAYPNGTAGCGGSVAVYALAAPPML